jgi:DNA-directed RNA polymerase subunit M
MYPKDGNQVCRKCGYVQKKKTSHVIVSEQKKKDVTVIEDSHKANVLPKTEKVCPKCDNTEAYWILRQMRGSDEPESRFYTCTKCGYKWRED